MKRLFLLSLTCVLTIIGAWAQNPVPQDGTTPKNPNLGENEYLYYQSGVGGNDDKNCVFAYHYYDIDETYVMGKINPDGTAKAIKLNQKYSDCKVIDESNPDILIFKCREAETGAGVLYYFETEDGYITDKGYKDGAHGIAVIPASELDKETEYGAYWMAEYSVPNTYNHVRAVYGSHYSISLIMDGDNAYFKMVEATKENCSTGVYFTYIFSPTGCQHPSMQHTPEAAPTCNKHGTAEYWHCSDCERYYSDVKGINANWTDSHSQTLIAYDAVDKDGDGLCDDCGKPMPIYKPVASQADIIAGGKYMFVAHIDGKYYAATADAEQIATGRSFYDLPSIGITPEADGSVKFMGDKVMRTTFKFANGINEWGGLRYGFHVPYNGIYCEYSTEWGAQNIINEYDGAAKYGYYVKLDDGSDGTVTIQSSYDQENYHMHAFKKDDNVVFSFQDKTEQNGSGTDIYSAPYPVHLYRLTNTGKAGEHTYTIKEKMADSDYTAVDNCPENGDVANMVEGIENAITDEAICNIVNTYVTETAIPASETVNVTVSAKVTVDSYKDYEEGKNGYDMTVDIQPVAVVTSESGEEKTYDISDSDLNGTTPMTVNIYTPDIIPTEIIHEKEDGTEETYYDQWSEEAQNGEPSFERNWTEGPNGSSYDYIAFNVTEFSKFKLRSKWNIILWKNNGDNEHSLTSAYSGYFTLPACPFEAPEGKMFAGWAQTSDGEVVEGTTILITQYADLYAIWKDNIGTGVEDINAGAVTLNDVYNLQGTCVKRNASAAEIHALPAGIYIVGGKKLIIK